MKRGKHTKKSKPKQGKPNRQIAPFIILGILILAYIAFFSIMSIDRHDRFQSLAFDLGIYDQAIWKFAHFAGGFNTVRGIEIFGDHITPINLLVAPLYWFTDDVRALLVLQTLAFALSAVPLFFIAYHYLKSRWASLVVCFSLLMFPAMHFVNLEDYHPECFILLFVLCAFYFLIRKKYPLYMLFVVLTLMCKEEVALTMFLVGIYVFFKYSKKYGLITSGLAVAWFLIAVLVVAPHFNGDKYLYSGYLLGQFGEKPLEIAGNLVNPAKVSPAIFNSMNGKFMLELFGPVAFLPVLGPVFLLMSASLWMNIITSWPYSHNIYYHYIVAVIPFVFLGIVSGLWWVKKKCVKKRSKKVFKLLLVLLFVAAFVGSYYYDNYDASIKNYTQISYKLSHFGERTQHEQEIYSMLALIPPNASVSARYDILPHLAHREKIYNFPNPFEAHYWGTWTEQPPLEYVDYFIITRQDIKDYNETIVPILSDYNILRRTSDLDFLLYKRKQ